MFCGALRIVAMVLSILAMQTMVLIAIPRCNRPRTRAAGTCPDRAGDIAPVAYPDLGHLDNARSVVRLAATSQRHTAALRQCCRITAHRVRPHALAESLEPRSNRT